MNWKHFARRTLNVLHLDLTKNLEYDRLTAAIMKRSLRADSNCVDVGAHHGEMLDLMIQMAPSGEHWAFEPIPAMFESLKARYTERVHIFPYALSDKAEETTFHYVRNAPAYSGLKKRSYATHTPNIELISVQCRKLDDLIPADKKIDFIKIDVEGAEYAVLKGAKHLIQTHHPTIIFEFGLGASDYYGTQPQQIFNLLQDCGMVIFTLKDFLRKGKPLTFSQFERCYETGKEYYFLSCRK